MNSENTIFIFSEMVAVNPLDTLLQKSIDFKKFDVDEVVIQALEAASGYLEDHQPKVRSEVLHLLKTPFEDLLQKVG
ncbi:MAG: hypothetical protein O7C75_04810 [Verrucomicrobia bacterium]|nr:hypothetical protein [Verrucomicrobiota bacterium]